MTSSMCTYPIVRFGYSPLVPNRKLMELNSQVKKDVELKKAM